jgi:hypothetical protein
LSVVEWDAEPGQADEDGNPAATALSDFVLSSTPTTTPTDRTARRSVPSIDRPTSRPSAGQRFGCGTRTAPCVEMVPLANLGDVLDDDGPVAVDLGEPGLDTALAMWLL